MNWNDRTCCGIGAGRTCQKRSDQGLEASRAVIDRRNTACEISTWQGGRRGMGWEGRRRRSVGPREGPGLDEGRLFGRRVPSRRGGRRLGAGRVRSRRDGRRLGAGRVRSRGARPGCAAERRWGGANREGRRNGARSGDRAMRIERLNGGREASDRAISRLQVGNAGRRDGGAGW